jgi:hypothetical protein
MTRYLLVGALLALAMKSDSTAPRQTDSLATFNHYGLTIWSGSPSPFSISAPDLRP